MDQINYKKFWLEQKKKQSKRKDLFIFINLLKYEWKVLFILLPLYNKYSFIQGLHKFSLILTSFFFPSPTNFQRQALICHDVA